MDFELSQEVEEITEQLLDKHKGRFVHIKVDRMLFAQEISGHRVRFAAKIYPIRQPFDLLDPNVLYILSVFRFHWEDLSDTEKERAVMRELCCISIEFDGSLVKIPINDFPEVLVEYGIPEYGLKVERSS